MINRVYRTVKAILNNDFMGNVNPQEYNLILNTIINEKYEEYFFDLNRLINRENKGLINNDFSNIPKIIRKKIRHYYQPGTIEKKSSGYYPLPEDIRYLDGVYKSGIEVDELTNSRQLNLAQSCSDVAPDEKRPAFLNLENKIKVVPDTIDDELEIFYLRKPKKPKWTFSVVQGVEMFNPDANDFQDIDMHESEETDIIRRVLLKFGVNLKENDIIRYAENEKNINFQQENIS